VLLVELFLPSVNNLMQRSMSVSWLDPNLIAFLAGLWLLTGLGAGVYPALYLSGFRPVRVLKDIKTVKSKGWLRRTLVTFQLVISVVLIISTIIIHRQMQLARDSQPGFDEEQIVMIPTRDKVGDRYETIRSSLRAKSGIQSVTTTSFEPGEPGSISFFQAQAVEDYESEDMVIMDGIDVGFDFTETFGVEVTRGRSFSEQYRTDLGNAVMINEKAVRYFGWEDPLGKTIFFGKERKIVGVIEDFHYKSLKEEVKPVLITPTENASRFIAAKLAGGSIPGAMDAIQSTWSEVIPEMPLNYSFLDDSFDALYRTEHRLNTLITSFSILAIVIACLGLVGLSAYSAERRTKEIGIRKVLGASISQIVTLLTKDFTKWMVLGFVLAIPIAQYAMTEWLKSFEYKVNVGFEVYLIAGGIVSTLVLFAVSWQSIRAALANPIVSLRNE
jgi:putative ABC transport system permease protein